MHERTAGGIEDIDDGGGGGGVERDDGDEVGVEVLEERGAVAEDAAEGSDGAFGGGGGMMVREVSAPNFAVSS